MRPLGFRHLPDLGLEICLVGEETGGEHLVSWKRNRGRMFVWLEKSLRMNICLVGEETEGGRLFSWRRN